MWHWINLYCFIWEVISKTRASCFIRGSKHLETIKELGLWPRAFICFSVFGTPDETLALVFDILHEHRHILMYYTTLIIIYWPRRVRSINCLSVARPCLIHVHRQSYVKYVGLWSSRKFVRVNQKSLETKKTWHELIRRTANGLSLSSR